ncbi:DUF4272 domain-containing protein [Archangium sp.]|uniref:DUF4272 domain-containing protein n=1 Tax=Archangium sp. TaxID=1872627 RepID=UPI00389A7E54
MGIGCVGSSTSWKRHPVRSMVAAFRENEASSMKADALEQSEWDTPARSGDEILERLFCLAALHQRFIAERAPKSVNTDELAGFTKSVLEWLEGTGAAGALSPVERTLFSKLPRTWTLQETLDASWRMEGEAVMAWALGLMPQPPYDRQADPNLLVKIIAVGEPVTEAVRSARLRPVEELARAQEEAERWYWRATAAMPYFANARGGWFARFGKSARWRAEMVRRAIGEEATLFGKEYARLSPEQFWTARSIARERLYALNWIWDGADWDDVLVDT